MPSGVRTRRTTTGPSLYMEARRRRVSDAPHEEVSGLLKQASDLGHSRARTELGQYLEFGLGTTSHLSAAVHCYQIAARAGLADAKYELGLCYQEGRGLRKNYRKVTALFQEAAKEERGHARTGSQPTRRKGHQKGYEGRFPVAYERGRARCENGRTLFRMVVLRVPNPEHQMGQGIGGSSHPTPSPL